MSINDSWTRDEGYIGDLPVGERRKTSHKPITLRHVLLLTLTLCAPFAGIILGSKGYLTVIVTVLTTIIFATVVLRITAAYIAAKLPARRVSEDVVRLTLARADLPYLDVFLPVYREVKAIPALVANLSRLRWPADKIRISLHIRHDDIETMEVAQRALENLRDENGFPDTRFRILQLPPHFPHTKPSSLNFGLDEAVGDVIVIFDAENAPDPDQAIQAWLEFERSPSNVVAVAAKPRIWNVDGNTHPKRDTWFHNWVTNTIAALFSMEYSYHYARVISALIAKGWFTPLPGNSVYFKTHALQEIMGWDPWNKTEDAEVAVRLTRMGWRISYIDSFTREEAPPSLTQMINQRTRWTDGFYQTAFVHLHNPIKTAREMGTINFLFFLFLIIGQPLAMLVQPWFSLLTLIYFTSTTTYMQNAWPVFADVELFIQSLFPTPVFYMGVFNMIVGISANIYFYMYGSMREKTYSRTHVPLYGGWLYGMLISVASWKAVYDFIFNPHQWRHTEHSEGRVFGEPETVPVPALFEELVTPELIPAQTIETDAVITPIRVRS